MTSDAPQPKANRSLLVVHGRDFKPGRDQYMEVTTAAMRRGIERDFPDCVGSFDLLQKHIAWYADLSADILTAAGKTYDVELDAGDRRNALAALSELAPRKKFGIRMYDQLPGKSALPEFFADIGAPVLGAVGLKMPVIGRLARDFAAYFDESSGYAESTRARVRDPLCRLMDQGERIMLITHGTGSVIAYDVLWELSNDDRYSDRYGACKIEQWLTLGSPLGDRSVQKRLLGWKEKGGSRFPGNVISWHNLSAEDDYTCHDSTLADDFKKMMQERRVSAVHDYRIFNLAVRYGKSNPHSSVGYYIHPRVAKIIVDWLS